MIFECRAHRFFEDRVIEFFPIVSSDGGGGNFIYKHYTTDTGVVGKLFTTLKSKELVFVDGP